MNQAPPQTLTDFLLERIAEDEATARAASSGRYPDMHIASLEAYVEDGDDDTDVTIGGGDLRGGTGSSAVAVVLDGGRWMAEHIVRHDPARVLAECKAKRRIVEVIKDSDHDAWWWYDSVEPVLRLLALPYADHESYRPEWRP